MTNLPRGGQKPGAGRHQIQGFARSLSMRFLDNDELSAMEHISPRLRVERILYGSDSSELLLQAIQDIAKRLDDIESRLKSGIIQKQENENSDGSRSAHQAMEDFE